jgi:hypothetical protein
VSGETLATLHRTSEKSLSHGVPFVLDTSRRQETVYVFDRADGSMWEISAGDISRLREL